MSSVPENELDLEKLFLPAWAQEEPSASKYAKYEGGQDRPDRRGGDRRGPRPPRRDGPPGERREGGRPQGGPRRSPGERGGGQGRRFGRPEREGYPGARPPERRE